MSYKAGNRFKEDTYFLTEVETDGTSAKVTGQLNGEEVDFESGGTVTVEPLSVTENGEYEALEGSAYNPVTVEVPNSYTNADEGKVVSSGALVSQTSTRKTANGTYDTTLNDEVVVEVPNTYTNADEGKVVSSGALVSQTSTTKTANGTYDTTLNNEVVVNVPSSGQADMAALIDGSITSLIVPNGATAIRQYMFYGSTNLRTVSIPGSVTRINSYAFYNCTSLETVDLSEGLTSIGDNVFQETTNLNTLELPSTLTSITSNAFRNKIMNSLTCKATIPPTCYANTFASANIAHVYVPSESVEAYKVATGWSNFASVIEAIPTP